MALVLNESSVPNEGQLCKRSHGAAGFDLASNEHRVIKPDETVVIDTGIRLVMPYGMEGQIRSRSGLAVRHGVVVLLAPGTIDCDYHGVIKVIMHNFSKVEYVIHIGEHIAQMVFAQYYPMDGTTNLTPASLDVAIKFVDEITFERTVLSRQSRIMDFPYPLRIFRL